MRRPVLVAVALFLASCTAAVPAPTATTSVGSGSSNGPSDGPAVSPSPSAAATAPPSPTATPRTSFALGGVLGSAQGDFDCDGHPDLLEFFNAPRPGTYASLNAGKLARLTLSAGGVLELPFDGMPFDDPGQTPLIGLADVNGDGCDDAIVTVGHGASTIWTSFLVVDGNELRLVEEDGKQAIFLFAGSVRHGNAIECRRTKDAPEIVTRAASDYTSEFQWDTVEDVHRWSTKSRLVLWSTSRSVIAVSVAYTMPTDHDRYWGLSCGNVKFGG
ncbi:MAG: hypothetical protein AUH39_01385 [Chloroflexi bacterium 13_1_40CM_67_9]|nr:MAG: hypothetical protein AUH39_01385 [Chloroflexi bacterium 13_1_40CM_67_9]